MSVSNTDEMDEESRSLKSRAQNANSKIDTTCWIVSRVNNKHVYADCQSAEYKEEPHSMRDKKQN